MKVDHINLINTRHHIVKAISYCEPECHNPFMRVVLHLLSVAMDISARLAYPRGRR